MAEFTIDDVQKTIRDSFYVAVGLGVIAFQKAQVQRTELQQRVETNVAEAQRNAAETIKTIEERLEAVESRIDAVLDEVAERLPEQAAAALTQARTTAKETRSQLRSLAKI